MTIVWYEFAPKEGGSMGREDMGLFCEANSSLFIVPFFETVTDKASILDLSVAVEQKITEGNIGKILEFSSGEFTDTVSADWQKKIKSSLIFRKR